MADSGGDVSPPKKIDSREEKLRLVRERQAEERQRRLEELKKHALEAQQFREQKEIERRKRMEDCRQKENERRSQVEERKRQIWEAEKERREAIVRKNQEREARIDAKRKNERSNIVFAFGSSTPRMLETTDSHCFWGPRRATSTANLRLFPTTAPTVPLSRKTPERELELKKRASSAGGLYRNPGDLMSTSMYEVFHWDSQPGKPRLSVAPQTDPSLSDIDAPACRSVPQTPVHPKPFPASKVGDSEENGMVGSTMSLRANRRKTDLMPTIPTPRDGVSSSRPASGSRSLARTPGDLTPSRPGSVLSQYSVTSASNPTPRLRQTPRRPRPLSIHVTGISKDKEKILSPEENPKVREVKDTKEKTPKPMVARNSLVTKKQNQQKNEEIKKTQQKITLDNDNENTLGNKLVEDNKVNAPSDVDQKPGENDMKELAKVDNRIVNKSDSVPGNASQVVGEVSHKAKEDPVENVVQPSAPTEKTDKTKNGQTALTESSETAVEDESAKANVMSRSKITTEEEAKAALAERRRLAREQAEREAEAERIRLELEAQKEAERIRKEEEEQRLAEEEQLRLLEESRRIEENRLMQAIEEAKKREEEERERRQQEELARLEKEQQEKKAREEEEKQRIEMAERLKREEEERQARRKRVEAIMKRTRNNPSSSINKSDCEKGEEDGAEHEKDESKGNIEAFLNNERMSADRSLTNGQSSVDLKENVDGINKVDESSDKLQSNGVVALDTKGLANEDCIDSNSTMVTPLIAFQGKTKETPVAANYMA